MSYLIIFAALVAISFYMDLSAPLAGGIILAAMTIWRILLNPKWPIPKW